ncbi:MAG: hypothetical protein ACWGQW_11945 [bacterium]
MHYMARDRETKDWRLIVRSVCGLPRLGEVQGKCRVTITLHRKKLQDPDNAVGSVKPVLDALKRNGWLVDDSPEYLELIVREEKSKEQRTVIEWEANDE